ncbi:MAG TPA: alpha-amylase [Thiothrix sp.]|nr:alpha-amylase [Thiothrix sp.]
MNTLSKATQQSLRTRLSFIYDEETTDSLLLPEINSIAKRYRSQLQNTPLKQAWDEQDVVLITYGDSIRDSSQKQSLATLKRFADKYLKDAFSTIHLLPIFPYTSDDGFSVADYRMIRSDLGDWEDVGNLRENFDLMFDFVLNHCSRVSLYFADFRADREPYKNFFIYEDPEKDWSNVVRPRSTPLLTEIPTREGMKYVWTTFSADQVDLNYKNPRVLLEVIDILLFYISQGSRITRLDAIAFLWKEVGTKCLHLPQTHEIVKVLRDLVNELAPGALLLTETNVPHKENMSYFGEGDEAHMVYQFSLPPLLLHAIHAGNTSYLYDWLKDLSPPPEGGTYFNFTASHDGIGVRPLEGLLPDEEVKQLLEDMRARGAYISTRRNKDGHNSPYEINVTYYDAFRNPGNQSAPWQVARFLLSQTFALSMRGIPGIYIHSLLATANDHKKVEVTGATRSINRHQWSEEDLESLLEVPESNTFTLVNEYLRRIRLRRAQAAFHPDAPQKVLRLENTHLLGILRTSGDEKQTIVALYNFGKCKQYLDLQTQELQFILGDTHHWWDLIYDLPPIIEDGKLVLKPYACHWLVTHAETKPD